jgi:hypothetical protein
LELGVNLTALLEVLSRNDGSLPEIILDFSGMPVIADAYQLIQNRATAEASQLGHFWSKSQNLDCPILFGDNPAQAFLAGDADSFHVCFGGIRSTRGAEVPLLGFFVEDPAAVALDYRMGSDWNEDAIIGLFELMRELATLSSPVSIVHSENIFDPDGQILIGTYQAWLASN